MFGKYGIALVSHPVRGVLPPERLGESSHKTEDRNDGNTLDREIDLITLK
jgi:hypothetical protein